MSRDNLAQMREQAKETAEKSETDIALVHDPIGNAEESGDYGFCPAVAVDLLFPHGAVVEVWLPEGISILLEGRP